MVKLPTHLPKGILSKLADHLKWVEEPFDKSGNLLKDIVYEAGKKGTTAKYVYTTDSLGRIKQAFAYPLILDKIKRATHARATPGNLAGNHAGHLFADIFGGSPKLDNLVSQASSINQSKMKRLENKWAKLLGKEPPADINVSIEVQYGAGARPTGFVVTEVVDGLRKLHKFRQ